MTQAAKRRKLDMDFLKYLTPTFRSEARHLNIYFHIALGCDTPIVEAILQTTYTITAFKEADVPQAVYLFLKGSISAFDNGLNIDYEDPYMTSWVTSAIHPPNYLTLKMIETKIYLFTTRTRFWVFAWTSKHSTVLQFDKYTRHIHIALDLHRKDWHYVRWGMFESILEEQLKRFRSLPIPDGLPPNKTNG